MNRARDLLAPALLAPALLALTLPALVLTACGSDDDAAADGVSIENAWARTSAAGQTTGAIYFDLTVDEDDTLSGASVPASVAADAQIHEVVMSDMSGDDMGDMGSDTTDMGDMGSDMGSTRHGDMGSARHAGLRPTWVPTWAR